VESRKYGYGLQHGWTNKIGGPVQILKVEKLGILMVQQFYTSSIIV
jgi:hypothetical protein